MEKGKGAGSTLRQELILAFSDQLRVEIFLPTVPASRFPFPFLHAQLSHLTGHVQKRFECFPKDLLNLF